jgi:hypothetical protein
MAMGTKKLLEVLYLDYRGPFDKDLFGVLALDHPDTRQLRR